MPEFFEGIKKVVAECGISDYEPVCVNCDLEVSPSVLVDFYKKIKSSSADVVYGYQEKRKGGIVEKNSG